MNKTLVFNDVEMNKKDFYDAKKALSLNLVNRIILLFVIKSKIIMIQANILLVIYTILMKLVHCVLFTTNEWLYQNFENGGKNMSFKIEDENVYIKYNQI